MHYLLHLISSELTFSRKCRARSCLVQRNERGEEERRHCDRQMLIRYCNIMAHKIVSVMQLNDCITFAANTILLFLLFECRHIELQCA